MRPHHAKEAAKAVHRLNDLRDEPRVLPFAVRKLANGNLDARQQTVDSLTFLVGHGRYCLVA